MIDEIEPLLRFCAYTLQMDISSGTGKIIKSTTEREKENLIKGYDKLVQDLEKNGARVKREAVQVTWRGKDIPVRNAQLVTVMMKVQTSLKGLEADGGSGAATKQKKRRVDGRKEIMGARRMATYDRTLLVLSEAEEVARQLVEDNKVPSRSLLAFPTFSLRGAADCAIENEVESL